MHSQKKAAPPKPMPSPSTNPEAEKGENRSHLDFLCADFNRIDELDDTTDNYREFENLSGVVTADMRFQALRRRRSENDECEDAELVSAIKHANAEKSQMPEESESKPLIMVSEGRVVIVSALENKARNCAEILDKSGLSCSICLVDESRPAPWAPSSGAADSTAKAPVIHGYFGGFSVNLGDARLEGEEESFFVGQLSGSAGKNERCFDMVLDMRSPPCYAGEQLPLGYYGVGEDQSALQGAIEEMAEMKGRFSKPRLVSLRSDRCIRGRHPQVQCDRCLRICPFAAIEEEAGCLMIDHYKCQGCGACGLVCEAEAMECAHPRPEELVADICSGLQEWTAAQTSRPQVILVDGQLPSTFSKDSGLETDALSHRVEEVGRLSVDVLLVLLAAGAGSVTVVCDKQRPAGLRRTLAEQIGFGREILALLKLSPDCLRLHVASRQPGEPRRPLSPAPSSVPGTLAPAAFDYTQAGSGGDRLRRAVDHFRSQQDSAAAALDLSPGAPFGKIDVDTDCSLCMACVGICPSRALSAGGNIPRLHFIEARCHQCGLCSTVCPEKAITLRPRLLSSVEAARSPVVVCEVEAFHCIECGEPFAARSMIAGMQQSLAGHWMFKEERQQRRLQMCAACRTRDALLERGY